MASRSVSKMAVIALLCLMAAVPGAAWPSLYTAPKYDPCVLPTQGYGNHQDPEVDNGIVLEVMDGSGAAVSSYVPGETYTISVTPTASSRGIIITDGGEFTESTVVCEGKRYTFPDKAELSTVTWTAPATTDIVTFGVNFASGFSAPYKQSTATLSPAVPEPSPESTPAATTPAPTEAGAESVPPPGPPPGGDSAAVKLSSAFASLMLVAAMGGGVLVMGLV